MFTGQVQGHGLKDTVHSTFVDAELPGAQPQPAVVVDVCQAAACDFRLGCCAQAAREYPG